MNFPQHSLIKDTVLNGGLIAAAALWLLFSAVHLPVNERASASTIASTPARAGACALVTPPAPVSGKAADPV
jgi:hypothetical protein